jgi:hypothetical protein
MILFQLVSLVFPAVYAQDRDQLKDQAEELLHQDENSRIPVEVLEEYQEMTGHPVNLNTATPEELGASRLFTSFQVHMIIEYRELNGELLSIYELASITGFRVSRLKEIAPYITVTNNARIIRRHTTSNRVLLFTGRSFPDALGQGSRKPEVKEPVYAGSPLKTSLRVKMALGKYTELGLAYGKDPGEKGFQGIRPEYLAGYIHYRGRRILEQVVLGSFKLHNGLGLVQGGNLFNAPATFNSRPQLLSSLKPYAGLSGSGTHRGVAFRLNMQPVKVTLWSSLQSMDLSVGDLLQETGKTDWVAYRRHTGLHRTPVEQAGYNLGYLANAGIQAMIYRKNFTLGAQFSSEMIGLTNKGKDSLEIPGNPSIFSSAGIHWRWRLNRFETFGEYSAGKLKSSAVLTGFRYHFNDFLSGSLLFHGYGTTHRETFSSAYASGSHISNEKGMMMQLYAEPGRNLIADFSAELFGYPSSRYLTQVPSSGYRYSCTLQSTGPGKLQWRIRFVKKIWQQTPSSGRQGIRSLIQNQLTRADGRVDCQLSDMLKWQSRLVATFVSGDQAVPGYAALQQVGVNRPAWLKCTIQFVVFNIPHWDNRIYLYEPGLYHHFDFPVYSGRGQKLTMLVSLNPANSMILEGKISAVSYHDRDQVGSGNDVVEGSRKFSTGLQLRFTF